MVFNQFARDVVTIVKPNGNKIENVMANVQAKKIFINNKTIPLEDGDKIIRTLPTGVTESYIVLDNGFYHGGNGLPGGYQATVIKESANSNSANPSNTIVYNINANNSNINVNPNNSYINNSIYEENIFTKIRTELDAKITDDNLKNKILPLLSDLEQSRGTDTFSIKYNAFISSLANHMTIIAPFIPALMLLR